MTSLKQYIEHRYGARRHETRRPIREDAGEVVVSRSPGLDTASVSLPGGIGLEDRAARMNEFWKALVEFQYRDVVVIAVCISK